MTLENLDLVRIMFPATGILTIDSCTPCAVNRLAYRLRLALREAQTPQPTTTDSREWSAEDVLRRAG